MKTMLIIVALGIFLIATLSSVHAYEAFHGPNELIYYDKAEAFNGYTLFSPGLFPYIFLIDMEGNVVHSWFVPDKSWDCNPQLLDNGNVFYRVGGRGKAGGYQEVDWNAKPVWKWDGPREDLSVHHDQIRIFNKTINAYTTMGLVSDLLQSPNEISQKKQYFADNHCIFLYKHGGCLVNYYIFNRLQ